MTENKVRCVYPRLQLAYLLEFAIWGSWCVALGGYLNGKMSGPHIGALYMAIPWGAIIAPMFIGPIADRYFSAQKVLGLLHLISGAALVACGVICAQAEARAAGGAVVVPFGSLMVLMLISGICFMPSIALINTVVFKHIPDSASAPKVFIFGTAGWIVVNLVVEVFAGGAASPNFFFIGGGCGIFLGLYSFTLPDTPPKGAPAEGAKKDIFGLGALSHVQVTHFYHLRPLRVYGQYFRQQLLLPVGGGLPERIRLSGTGCPDDSQPVLGTLLHGHPSVLRRQIRPQMGFGHRYERLGGSIFHFHSGRIPVRADWASLPWHGLRLPLRRGLHVWRPCCSRPSQSERSESSGVSLAGNWAGAQRLHLWLPN